MAERVFGIRMVPRFVRSFSQEGTLLGYPASYDAFASFLHWCFEFVADSWRCVFLLGEDGGIQHAGGLTGIHDNLEGETY